MDTLTKYVANQYDYFQETLEKVNRQNNYLNYGYTTRSGMTITEKQAELCRQVFHLADFQEDDVVIDVGFGSGRQDFLLLEEEKFKKLIGFNVASRQVENARRQARELNVEDKLSFHQSPAEDMSLIEDNTADKIMSIECAFYFDRPRFYKEAARVLKPGGKLVLADITFNDKLKFLTRRSEDLQRVGSFSANREAWEKHFNTVSVRTMRFNALRGAQQTVFICCSSLLRKLSFGEVKTWLKMASNTQLVVYGLITGLIHYDLIVLENK